MQKKERREHALKTISENLIALRSERYPGRGGSKKCSDELGLKQQQWSPWEKGLRVPNEESLKRIADHFGVTVDYLRTDHTGRGEQGAESAGASDFASDMVAQTVKKQLASMNMDKFKVVFKLELSILGFEIQS